MLKHSLIFLKVCQDKCLKHGPRPAPTPGPSLFSHCMLTAPGEGSIHYCYLHGDETFIALSELFTISETVYGNMSYVFCIPSFYLHIIWWYVVEPICLQLSLWTQVSGDWLREGEDHPDHARENHSGSTPGRWEWGHCTGLRSLAGKDMQGQGLSMSFLSNVQLQIRLASG